MDKVFVTGGQQLPSRFTMEGTMDNRIEKLKALAETEGITLPYPPEVIVRIEDTGAVVDLVTGVILIGEAYPPYRWAWTPSGKAIVYLLLESEV